LQLPYETEPEGYRKIAFVLCVTEIQDNERDQSRQEIRISFSLRTEKQQANEWKGLANSASQLLPPTEQWASACSIETRYLSVK
jgi:hypothetical protein